MQQSATKNTITIYTRFGKEYKIVPPKHPETEKPFTVEQLKREIETAIREDRMKPEWSPWVPFKTTKGTILWIDVMDIHALEGKDD